MKKKINWMLVGALSAITVVLIFLTPGVPDEVLPLFVGAVYLIQREFA